MIDDPFAARRFPRMQPGIRPQVNRPTNPTAPDMRLPTEKAAAQAMDPGMAARQDALARRQAALAARQQPSGPPEHAKAYGYRGTRPTLPEQAAPQAGEAHMRRPMPVNEGLGRRSVIDRRR